MFQPHKEEFPVNDIAHCFKVNNLNGLDNIVQSKNEEYEQLVEFIRSKQAYRSLPEKHVTQHYKAVVDRLSLYEILGSTIVILDGTRIVVLNTQRQIAEISGSANIPSAPKRAGPTVCEVCDVLHGICQFFKLCGHSIVSGPQPF